MPDEGPLARGRFYNIFDRGDVLVLEDRTKRGLEPRNRTVDEKYGVEADKGMIHDMDGIGHLVGIRWYFPKSKFSADQVRQFAVDIETRYRAIQEVTCPDDE